MFSKSNTSLLFTEIFCTIRQYNKEHIAKALGRLIVAIFAMQPLISLPYSEFLNVDFDTISRPELKSLLLQKGRQGNAMIAGSGLNNLILSNESILNPKCGTVAFWLKPVDWQAGDDSFHVFFEAKGATSFVLYKYFQDAKLIWLVGDVNDTRYADIVESPVKWKSNEWQHLAVTWSDEKIALYVNGILAAEKTSPVTLGRTAPSQLSIGDQPWNTAHHGKTLIDDLYIFNDELTNAEIIRLTTSRYPNKVSDFGIDSNVRLNDTLDETSILIHATRNRFLDLDRYSVNIVMSTFAGHLKGEILRSEKVNMGALVRGLNFPLKRRDIRQVEIQYEIYEGNSPLLTHKQTIDIPQLELLTQSDAYRNIANIVPKPWKNVTFSNNIIEATQSRFGFGENVLLSTIGVAENPLLAAPMTLHIHQNNKEIKLAGTRPVISQRHNDAVEFKFGFTVEGRDVASISGYIEFDGMLWIEIEDKSESLLSDANTDIHIDIPIVSSTAQYMHRWTENSVDGNNTLSNVTGKIESFAFIPFVWLGNESQGLFWFSESAENWPNALDQDAISIHRTDEGTVLKLHIKKSGQQLKSGRTFSFGLLPTPLKPTASKVPALRLSPLSNSNATILWPDNTEGSFKFYGHPRPKSTLAYKAKLSQLRNKGIKAIPYICPTFVSTDTPEWAALQQEWDVGIYDSTSHDVMAYRTKFALVSPKSQFWKQFVINSLLEHHKSFGLDGVYIDNIQPYGIYSSKQGYGFRRGDRAYKSYPIRAQREIIKSLYKVVKSVNPNALIIGHSSGKLALPLLSFVDIYVDGEQFRNRVGTSYFDTLSLASFRAEFMGIPFGLTPLFLPQPKNHLSGPDPTKSMMTLAALHNTTVWPIWSNIEYINQFYKVFDRLRPLNSHFIGYYSKANPFYSKNQQILVSSYCGDNDRCLLIAGNISKNLEHGFVCSSQRDARFEIRHLNTFGEGKLNSGKCIEISIPAESSLMIDSLLL